MKRCGEQPIPRCLGKGLMLQRTIWYAEQIIAKCQYSSNDREMIWLLLIRFAKLLTQQCPGGGMAYAGDLKSNITLH